MALAVTGEFRVPRPQSAERPTQDARGGSRVGFALAGGVMEGAFYEMGVLCALEEAIEGLDCSAAHAYVGVSAGAVVASMLANGAPVRTIAHAAVTPHDEPGFEFDPGVLLTPAFGEYLRRASRVPAVIARWMRRRLENPLDVSILGTLAELSELAPLGLFDSRPLERWLAQMFSHDGRTNDFGALGTILRIVAVRLDTSELVAFGDATTRHVPISRAVQASVSLPGLYCPTEIDGHLYIDGVARRTLNASLALDEGVDILFCVNPIVPVDMQAAQRLSGHARRPLNALGLPAVLSQTLRTLVHSRMNTAFRRYGHEYPRADLVLIEPSMDDDRMFFSNIFSVSNRRGVCEHAYDSTRRHLLGRADELEPLLARHGLTLRRDVLLDASRTLFGDLPPVRHRPRHVRPPARTMTSATDELRHALDRLDSVLARLSA
ncbi:MAG TPA: patatin-like phospholipase family protein [Gemmatimonadaceae bacterium]|nr:patatin-like phospholipase family protein [Gemmatimonadaceae bacterium]